MRARHLLVPLLALVPLVAGSSNDVVEGLTGLSGLDVRGNYDVIGSFEIYDAGDPVDAWSCAGSVAIPTQVGNQFSGTWALEAGMDCPAAAGGTKSWRRSPVVRSPAATAIRSTDISIRMPGRRS